MARKESLLTRTVGRHIDSSLQRVRDKGHERLTIMVIPHGKESVISLQLNWSMIFFLIGTLVLAVILAGYGVYWQALRSREIGRLEVLYGLNLRTAISVKKSIQEGMDLEEDLSERLRTLAVTLGVSQSAIAEIGGKKDARRTAKRALEGEVLERLDMGPGTDYLPPVYTQRTFSNLLRSEAPLLAVVDESLRYGAGVFSSMPMGRPLRPHPELRDTSGFGRRTDPVTGAGLEFHTGMDISAPVGTPVFATGAGLVSAVAYSGTGYGYSVLVQHENGFYSLYAHLSAILVRQGMPVNRKTMIGRVGRTGRATGFHLHYEVRLNRETKVDPLPYVCGTDLSSSTCTAYNRAHSL